MKVRIIKPTGLDNRVVGQTYDLTSLEAELLIKWGQAELVVEPEPEGPAIEEPKENQP